MSASITLFPAMRPDGVAETGAIWVGILDLDTIDESRTGTLPTVITLDGAEDHQTARLLVRQDEVVQGYVTLAVVGRTIDPVRLRSAIDALPSGRTPTDPGEQPVSIVVCTRERPEQLREALISILACTDSTSAAGNFEVVVVDNAPSTDATRSVVESFSDPRVRYVLESRAGLSTARNAGLAAARHDIVAFTDDDVVVDRLWLRWLRRAFRDTPDAGCVSGLVPSGELRNDIQRYFDARVSWSKNLDRREFRLSEPPANLPLFPFCVGEFGTGANFAVRRSALLRLGSFDPALGVGTRTRGGEDIDIFVRILRAGQALVMEPSAVVWHRHRADLPALRAQAVGYGTGLGAWLAKIALQPATLVMALRRVPVAFGPLLAKRMTTVDSSERLEITTEMRRMRRVEMSRVLVGPFMLARERFDRLTEKRRP